MLKKISLNLTLLGLLILIGTLLYQPIIKVEKITDLERINVNSLISIIGKVKEIYTTEKISYLSLDNDLEVILSIPYKIEYQNKNISLIGKVEKFEGKKQIKILRIKIIE